MKQHDGLRWQGRYPRYIVERAYRRALAEAQSDLEAARRASDPVRVHKAQARVQQWEVSLKEIDQQ